MEYQAPQCFGCKYFISTPDRIGGAAKCSAYKNGCPRRVYSEGGSCNRFSVQSKGKRTTTRKSSKR